MRIEPGLFSEALTRYLKDGWPPDLRLVHMDADIYISTRPVLDTLCGPLRYRYLILFDEFYSVNHEFRAWREFTTLFGIDDWRVAHRSELRRRAGARCGRNLATLDRSVPGPRGERYGAREFAPRAEYN